ncbi:hypothetical protein SRB5_00540 [Streptomyces sp. RB5]|uniref:Acyl-CoA dehydrogenase/oxidase C-terminal domain-containing protein n=1 Tax=Streptomyces smaragdinus TaxID=2585196 RepID=A0A7K0C924_9ACTN|nr:acyl-CoA dehydrogenase family protein [Streptomyces smaragdinus]MQY09950.1 hypothetical protein [Streptomyces smaragdinus]
MSAGNDLQELADRLFTDKAGHDAVLAAEQSPLLQELWHTVAALGLPAIGIDETAGGSGGTLTDTVTWLTAAGRHAVPLPLLEHHLALWLLTASGGRAEGNAPWTIAPPGQTLTLDGNTATGTLHDVAWGGGSECVVVHTGTNLLVLDTGDATVTPGRDLAGQPRDTLTFERAGAEVRPCPVPADHLARRGAVLRAAQMAGAMAAVNELSRRYTAERRQFGRPIGTFQAVRRHLVFLAQMAVTTQLAVDRAALALDASFAAFAAKLLADDNAAVTVRSGHQVHGAIGMTREYPLQDFTRRLNAWRGDWGTQSALGERIGTAVAGARRIASVATDEGSLPV